MVSDTTIQRTDRNVRFVTALSLSLSLLISLVNMQFTSGADTPTASLRTGARFRQGLQSAVNIVRPQSQVRDIFQLLASLHEISVLLDRRVDPDRFIDVQLSQLTLMDGLTFLAYQFDAEAAPIGSTVVIGPPESLDRMRTDIALQTERFKDQQDDEVRQRTFDLLQRRTFRWDDLTTPAEILEQVATEFDLQIQNVETVPYDLWVGGVMADVNAIEALAIVAGQFELTFSWDDSFTEIQLKASSPRLVIERLHTGPRDRIEVVVEAASEFPEATFEAIGRKLRVLATVREHEKIDDLLKGDDSSDDAPQPDSAPLNRRTFTITTKPVPAITVLRHLETQDVIVEYDPQELEGGGIDLLEKVTLSLTEASADEFFHALCDPLGLAFELDGKTVRIAPAP